MANTFDPSGTTQIPIPFADSPMPNRVDDHDYGIWSCRFSADGNEVIAGGDGNLYGTWWFSIHSAISLLRGRSVYDLLANRRTVKILAHDADVNSCCWADTGSGNVLVSASDDTFLKVWCVVYVHLLKHETKYIQRMKGSPFPRYGPETLWSSDRPH
jgi:WD repeat-containing protein 23